MDFNFPIKQGLGISKFLSHVTAECQDLILKLLCYNPEERYSAKQALNHPYFKEMVDQEQKLAKLSTNQFNPANFMKSFHNDSQSFIKSTDDTQNQINLKNTQRKADKVSYLPDIKVNIIVEANQKKNDSDDSDNENNKRSNITYLKLPPINKVNDGNSKNAKAGSNFFGSNEYKNQIKHNLSNQSLEIQINTQYSKNNQNMSKKMHELKKNYVSPYSQKIMNNNVKI